MTSIRSNQDLTSWVVLVWIYSHFSALFYYSGSGRVVLVDSEARKQAAVSGLPEPGTDVDFDLEKISKTTIFYVIFSIFWIIHIRVKILFVQKGLIYPL